MILVFFDGQFSDQKINHGWLVRNLLGKSRLAYESNAVLSMESFSKFPKLGERSPKPSIINTTLMSGTYVCLDNIVGYVNDLRRINLEVAAIRKLGFTKLVKSAREPYSRCQLRISETPVRLPLRRLSPLVLAQCYPEISLHKP